MRFRVKGRPREFSDLEARIDQVLRSEASLEARSSTRSSSPGTGLKGYLKRVNNRVNMGTKYDSVIEANAKTVLFRLLWSTTLNNCNKLVN